MVKKGRSVDTTFFHPNPLADKSSEGSHLQVSNPQIMFGNYALGASLPPLTLSASS